MVMIESGWQEAKISSPRHWIICRFAAWACKAAINSFKINKEKIKVSTLIHLTTLSTSHDGADFSIESVNLSRSTDLVLFPENKQRLLFLWHHPIFQPSFNLSDAVHERVNKSIKLFSLKGQKQNIEESLALSVIQHGQPSGASWSIKARSHWVSFENPKQTTHIHTITTRNQLVALILWCHTQHTQLI